MGDSHCGQSAQFLKDQWKQFFRLAGIAPFKRLQRLSDFTGHGEDGKHCGEPTQGA
jgi:hypothetical protein